MDRKAAEWRRQRDIAMPEGSPTAASILRSYPPVRGLVFGSTAGGGSKDVGRLCDAIAAETAQRSWRQLGAHTRTEAYSAIAGYVRARVGFSAAHAHARLRLSRIERVGHSGRTAGLMGEGGADALASPTAYDMGRNRLGGGGGRAAPFGGGGF